MTIQALYAALTADYEAKLLPPSVSPSDKPQRTWERVLVFGEGNRNHAPILLIGEAPGEQEEKQRRPFVGKAGKNLNEFLELARIERSEVYVSNTVRFRQTSVSKAGRIVNRTPDREETAFFRPFLLEEILLVKPAIVATLGNTPLKALAGSHAVIGELHGRILPCEGYSLYPMYHPASLIYNPSLKDTYREDILRLAELLSF